MEFLCKVGTPGGDVVEQSFQAPSENALRTELEQRGYYLFSIRRSLAFRDLQLGRRRVKPQRLLIFGQELAALLKAGLPLLQSLEVMLERQTDPVFRGSLEAVRDRVKSGWSLSDSFHAEGALYPPIFAASLTAGERSGDLETVLRRFVQYIRLNQALKKKAITASIYPVLLLSVMLGLVALLMLFVVPSFENFFDGLGIDLPLPTRVLMTVAGAAAANIGWIATLGVATIVIVTLWVRTGNRAMAIDGLLLRIPYIGPLMRMYATSQLARSLATLLAGGLPLVNALEVAASSVGNRAMGVAVAGTTKLIREGESLTTALESTRMLESLTLEMVKVGEQTGALSEMLQSVAEFYAEDLETRLETVLALVEPLLLILMALIVSGMLLAFYLPLFQAISALGGRL